MPHTLPGLLGNDKLRIVYEEIASLGEEVGDEGYELDVSELREAGALEFLDEIVLLGETAQVEGRIEPEATATILPADGTIDDFFGTGERIAAGDGDSLAMLRLGLGGSTSASVAPRNGALTVSARGSLSGGFTYVHVIPVGRDQRRVNAFGKLARYTEIPTRADLGDLQDRQHHKFDGRLNLDFGLDVEAGYKFARTTAVELFGDLPAADLEINGELTLRASLGLSLYERLFVALGREDDWIRVRMQREHQRRLGFGAMMALEAKYDFGGGLANVLEQALDEVQTPKLMETLREVRNALEPAAQGDWDAIEERLGKELAGVLDEFLDDTGWRDWAEDSPEVARLLGWSREIVDAYDDVEPTIRGFWDRLLGSADLGEDSRVREILQEIGALDPATFGFEDLLELLGEDEAAGEAGRLIEMVETFGGQSLEELLLQSEQELRRQIARVVDLATKAQKIFRVGDEAIAEWRDFAERTGIARTVEWLRDNGTSLDSFESFVSGRMKRLASKLVGKAWKEIDDEDLAKVQAWAEKTHDLLGRPEDLQRKLLEKIRQIQGELGFSVSLEIERVSESTALLDFQVDRTEKSVLRAVEEGLATGSIRSILETLADVVEEEKDRDRRLPFVLRECVFTSRRVRTNTSSLVYRLLGSLGKIVGQHEGINRRVEESSIRIRPHLRRGGREDALRRGSYSGGFSRTDVSRKTTNEAAIWLEAEDAGWGLRLGSHYDAERDDFEADDPILAGPLRDLALRATYSREDLETLPDELQILDRRLRGLGFAGADLSGVPPSVQTRLFLEVRFPQEAFEVLTRDLNLESEWNEDFLAAARVWLGEKLIRQPAFDRRARDRGFSQGDVIRSFIAHNRDFRELWTRGVDDFTREAAGTIYKVLLGAEEIPLANPEVVRQMPGNRGRFTEPYDALRGIIRKRRIGRNHLGRLRDDVQQLAGRDPAAYREASREFADAGRAIWVFSRFWPTPTFGSWLIHVRLSRLAPEVLADVRGAATLRWKATAEPDAGDETTDMESRWRGPLVWRLEEGLTPWGTDTA